MVSSGFAILLVIITLSGLGRAVLQGAITFKLYHRQFDENGNVNHYIPANPPSILAVVGITSLEFVLTQHLINLRKAYPGDRQRIIFVAFNIFKNKFVAGKFKRFDSKIPRLCLKDNEAAVEFFNLSRFSDYVRIVPTWDIAYKENTSIGLKIKTDSTPKKKETGKNILILSDVVF